MSGTVVGATGGSVAVVAEPAARAWRPQSWVPRPLAALLVVVALMGASWALVNPAWQAPDEDVHFSYVQTLAELGRLPGGAGASLSTAQVDAMQSMNTDPIVFFSFARPERSRVAYDAYQSRAVSDPLRDGGGPNTASSYPPAYYLLASLGYRLAGSSGVVTHLYAARLFSVLFLLITTTAVWLLAGELFGRRRELQLLAAAAVGLWPMLDFMSAAVNPDSLMYATWSLALWLGVRVLRRGLDVASGVGFGLVVGVALITKAPSLALVPASAFVVLFGLARLLWQRRPGAAALAALSVVLAFLAPVGAWHFTIAALDRPAYGQVTGVAAGALNVREFLSYVWQFYLPRLPFQVPLYLDSRYVSPYPAFNVWVATSWAAFGWVTVFFPLWVYKVFLAITASVALAAVTKGIVSLLHHRRSRQLWTVGLPVAIFLGLAAGALVLGLHLAEYRVKGPTNQGRYLFPLAGIAGCAVAYAMMLVPRRARTVAIGVALGGIVGYQMLALAFVAAHYYA